jgi:hypothetical protein
MSCAVDNLGLSSYPPAYLGEEAQTNNKSLLHGANFASGAAGYLDGTAALYVRHSLFINSVGRVSSLGHMRQAVPMHELAITKDGGY